MQTRCPKCLNLWFLWIYALIHYLMSLNSAFRFFLILNFLRSQNSRIIPLFQQIISLFFRSLILIIIEKKNLLVIVPYAVTFFSIIEYILWRFKLNLENWWTRAFLCASHIIKIWLCFLWWTRSQLLFYSFF